MTAEEMTERAATLAEARGLTRALGEAVARRYLEREPGDADAALRGVEAALDAAAGTRGMMAAVDALNDAGLIGEGQKVVEAALPFVDVDKGGVLELGLAQARLAGDVETAVRRLLYIEPERRSDLRNLQQDVYRQGRDRGLAFDLAVSVALAREMLDRAGDGKNRVHVLNMLGAALYELGRREEGAARLGESINAYRETLTIWTREDAPRYWVMAQHNLGEALATLGEREEGTARLNEAVAALRAALDEPTEERVVDRAETESLLDATLRLVEARESGRPDPASPASPASRTDLLANPPAEIVARHRQVDLDPALPGDAVEDAQDRELATLPRRQQNLARQIVDSLGRNQPTTRRALAQYRDELERPQPEIILEILKEAYLTIRAGIEQARREGALDDDALAAWARFEENHGVYLAHHPFDARREALYRNAPVDADAVDAAAVAGAFQDFLDTLGEEAVAEIVGERLRDWAEHSASLSRIIMEMAQNAAARGDIADEDMPHRVWLRRQVAQGWVMMVKIDAFLKTENGKKVKNVVEFTAAVATLAAFLGALVA